MKKLIRTGIAGLLALSLCGCSAMVQIAKIPGGDRGDQKETAVFSRNLSRMILVEVMQAEVMREQEQCQCRRKQKRAE